VKLWKAHLLEDQLAMYRDNRAQGVNFHEPEEERQFVSALRGLPDGAVLDIGAGVGYYSILCRKSFPHLEVHAFNPDPLFVQRMRANLRLNHVRDVRVQRVALSDFQGEARLELPGSYSGFLSANGEIRVQCTTLEQVLSEIRQHVVLVKLDVQGAELSVLQGAGADLVRVATLLVATHGAQLHEECLTYLRSRGFRVAFEAAEVARQYDGLIVAVSPESG
jgi:FkbM family methyltransferase